MFSRLTSPCLFLLVSTLLVAQEATEKSTPDPSGTWKWERDFNGNKIDYTLRLKVDDKKLTGTYQTIFENGAPGLAYPVKIDNGKLDGQNISFTVTRQFNENEFTVTYAGKIVDENKIVGSSKLDFGNGPQEFEWNAKFAVLAEDLVGKWNVKFETPNGEIESAITLAKKGAELSGTYHSSVFGDNPIKDIELKDGQLSFIVVFENDNGEFRVTYKAKPRGNRINGVIVANFGGQETETPFDGHKASTEKVEDGDADEE